MLREGLRSCGFVNSNKVSSSRCKVRNKITGCTSSACKPRKIRFERFALPDNNASIHWKGVKIEDCSTTDLTRL